MEFFWKFSYSCFLVITRYLYAQNVVAMVKSFLSTVGNVPVKDVLVLKKISKSKFHLELAKVVFSELPKRVMLDLEGTYGFSVLY